MKTAAIPWLLAGLVLAGTAHAQARYTCRGAGGSVVISDQPCMGEYRNLVATPPPSIGEAPAYIARMSPRCASLHDALRTANARGLQADTVRTMRKDYQNECAEDEREAQSAFARERGDQAQARRQAEVARLQAADQTRAHEERCGESRRILAVKKRRADLTEAEKAELQRFEQNVRARCG